MPKFWTHDEIVSRSIRGVPGWGELSSDDLEVIEISGGLTNRLCTVEIKYDVAVTKGTVHKVLFRELGDVSMFYDPELELKMYMFLSEANIAPKLICYFDGGRVEEFLEGDVLSVKSMRKPIALASVASRLARFHNVFDREKFGENTFFTRLHSWRRDAERVVKQIEDLAAQGDSQSLEMCTTIEQIPLESIGKGCDNAEKLLFPLGEEDESYSSNPMCTTTFCHNDCQETNVMYDWYSYRLIDFEYSAVGYAGYDIANYFCECTYDYHVKEKPYFQRNTDYPSYDEQWLFITCYLTENGGSIPPESEIKRYIKMIDKFSMFSDLVWGYWALIRQDPDLHNDENFDFLLYAKCRFEDFKRKYYALVQAGEIAELGIFPK